MTISSRLHNNLSIAKWSLKLVFKFGNSCTYIYSAFIFCFVNFFLCLPLNSIMTSIGFYHPIKIDVIKREKSSISSFIDEVIYNLSLFSHRFEKKMSNYSSLFRRFNRIQKKFLFVINTTRSNTIVHNASEYNKSLRTTEQRPANIFHAKQYS